VERFFVGVDLRDAIKPIALAEVNGIHKLVFLKLNGELVDLESSCLH